LFFLSPLQIVMALQKGENALLESPTGTGKTLALLCSSVSWLRNNIEVQEKARKIKNEDRKKKRARVVKGNAAAAAESECRGGDPPGPKSHGNKFKKFKHQHAQAAPPAVALEYEKENIVNKEESANSDDDFEDFEETLPPAPKTKKGAKVVAKGATKFTFETKAASSATKTTSGKSGKADASLPSAVTATNEGAVPARKAGREEALPAFVVGQHVQALYNGKWFDVEIVETNANLFVVRERRSDSRTVWSVEQSEMKADAVDTVMEAILDQSLLEDPSSSDMRKAGPSQIYFASRTHSQLTQVVKEFRNFPSLWASTAKIADEPEHGIGGSTKFAAQNKQLKMTVLASRELLCTHGKVSRSKGNKNEECKKLLEAQSCRNFKKYTTCKMRIYFPT
jgi:Rad3-related DNA helicase